ncbi:TadE-like protein [Sphingopyxis sp. YR583]|nr:TadE-like protein [Sphingopyxis sp. YR583]
MMPRPSLLSCKRGAVAAEMALILPFLVVLLFGSVELGYYFYNEHQVVKGVRDGARFASRQPFTAIGCNGTTPIVDAGAIAAIREITRTGAISGGSPRVPGWAAADIQIDVACDPHDLSNLGVYRDKGNPPRITISASVDYNALFGGLGVIDSTFSLNASQQAAAMGI